MRYRIIALLMLLWLAACAPGVPSASAPFQDSFNDAQHGWTLVQNNQASITIRQGQLQIAVHQPDSLAWSVAGGKSFADLTLDVDATPLAGPDDNGYGVIVRHMDDENFYRFEISSDGYYNVQKRVKGKWEKLAPDWTPSEAIRKGQATNHLRVVCRGSTLTFYVNQVQLIQVTDASFERGEIGVLAGTLTQPGVQIAFDNLRVSIP